MISRKLLSHALLLTLTTSLAFTACKKDDDEDEDAAASAGSTFTLSGSAGTAAALANISPSVASMKIYKFAVSKNTDCSDPKVVFDNGDDPQLVDMAKGPTLGSGKLDDGEYPCVIIEMSDELSFTPASDSGSCKTSEPVVRNVCDPRGDGPVEKTTLIDGTTKECVTGTEKVALYLSALSSVANGSDAACEADRENCSAFLPPTSAIPVRGIKLASPLVVKGDTAGTFVMDTTNKLTGFYESGEVSDLCDLLPPAFSFK